MIHIASESTTTDILSMLIALKSNINIKNNLNETPIHFAVRSKNIDAIDMLLNQGVDLSISTINGETPMFYAMKTGNLAIINMLYNNNSPLLGVDKLGNNLIHYCILNCPAFKENITKGKLGDITSIKEKSDKRDIIKFLIERGINTEQLNNDGISPLELSQKEINRELNKECALDIQQDNDQIKEFFFNMKPIREGMASTQPTNASKVNTISKKQATNTQNAGTQNTQNTGTQNTKNAGTQNTQNAGTQNTITTTSPNIKKHGARTIDKEITGYTEEHKHLLEIQTLLFNNVIRNNPNKYSGYISVDDIPKGSPIEVLDTVCVGNGMTGNEDTDECISKGGQIVKIENRTTKIKLELLPEDNILIDEVPQKDLYFKKNPDKVPKGTMPSNIQTYNNTITDKSPQTTGITYNIGETSTNMIDGIEGKLGFNPQPTKHVQPKEAIQSSNKSSGSISSINETPTYTEHPSMFDDYDDVVHKCKKDAISNSINLQNTKPQTTLAPTKESFLKKYKIPMIVFGVVILLIIIGIIIYHFYSSQE